MPNTAFVFDQVSTNEMGWITKEVTLDPATVQSWLSSNGTANNGLMIRGAASGTNYLSVIASQVLWGLGPRA